ncbi:MAG: hypothetical protein HWN66_12755 [Candidatus Helarchaeota archaeon]|nr:hypothetical protein [Candidatus Helarchaeota archaeon]
MSPYTLGDIPDKYPSKVYMPLGEHSWQNYQALGWKYFMEKVAGDQQGFFANAAEFLSEKFMIAIQTAKKVVSGEIPDPENVLTTWFFPPVLYVRSDLQMGTTKLLYGNSTDITFLVVNDENYEINLLINGHMENGVPVDYWYLLGEDEVFERRHLKLGHKLRDIPQKSKNFTEAGYHIIDILKDIRNERSPQWATSAYSMAVVWMSAAVNIFQEASSYSGIADVWDGVNSKRIYGLPDYYFCYVPWPPISNLLFALGRPEFTIRLTGLLTSNRLNINGFEPRLIQFYKDTAPELWDLIVKNLKENGVPTPRQTLGCQPPDLKDKTVWKNEAFDWIYPEGTRIMPYEWGLTEEEAFSGIYTDITHETPAEPFYGKEHITSMGIGREKW